MLLENTELNVVNETYDDFEHKKMDKEVLEEWFKASDASFGSNVKDINEESLSAVAQMALLQEKYINETNVSANVASFVPKLQPLLRRIVPKLIGMEIAGVQPVPTPVSEIFMLKAQYSGTTASPASATASIILEVTSPSGDFTKGETITGGTSSATGEVVYLEPDNSKMIVNVTSGTFVAAETITGGTSTETGTVGGVFSNELAFKQILPNYSGPYTTAAGEVLGAAMNQVRVRIVSQGITVKSRKLKAELTIELIKDMQAQHGASAEKEIMYFLEVEITNDMNQEIIDKYKEVAVNEANFALATTTDSQGRWSKEMYSGLYDRILKDQVNLSARNRRGKANILVATAGVISALMSLEKFKDIDSGSGVKPLGNHAMNYVGTLKDGTKVYQDWFPVSGADYYMVIYKGVGNYDAGVVFSPYTPLELLEATDPLTLQPILGLMTRYGLTVNNLLDNESSSVSDYVSYRGVDFTNTPLVD